ncbi:LRR receptor-like serine/threonine-protein kinase GSO1 [Cinnamomum micranthum f. kanehirae]|uniref:LRR receptor-like serine/threonine-protein kinase GSO1 n=1 Tax=Cinnamomum micranthum f. kanehirae TaxID=337451 RepID=A0A3S3NAF6_9MAGN|nr:LRR receptor-like serine/threonine-protein kinase GSO1 [Cinnamomum micranthum f. kanehirae]
MRPLASKNLDIYSFLDMSRNQLSGDIPATLGNLRGLKTLSLSYNKLFGRIPMSFGSLENLESLDLSHNNFSGEIPQTFTKLLQLSTLDLSNNNLEGQIPSGGQMDRMNDPNDFANNSGLCGVQIHVSCSIAPPPESLNEEHHESWFSWEGAGVGFPLGLFSTLATIYFAGFLSLSPKQRKMHNHNQRRRRLRQM